MHSSTYPILPADQVAWITATDMIEVDRIMIEDLGISLIQMMENAGRNLARLVLDVYGAPRVCVVAGSGGNGGGGMVAARHLANAGVDVTVTTTRPVERMGEVPAHQYRILERMGVPASANVTDAEVLVDAVIGYSLRGAPSGRSAELITEMDKRSCGVDWQAAVVSLDCPSGLDVTTGQTPGVAVRADTTLTLALPKVGLRNAPRVGDLYLADISVPRAVGASFGSPAPDFSESSVVSVAAA